MELSVVSSGGKVGILLLGVESNHFKLGQVREA